MILSIIFLSVYLLWSHTRSCTGNPGGNHLPPGSPLQLGRYCWSWFGGVYLLVAKKRVVPLTPIKLQWRTTTSNVVLPHVLEFEANPHQVLRESERVLIGEGHVVILGFNPWSLWGLWRLLLAWREISCCVRI